MMEVDVLIIGTGAAGLMCAIEAGKRARKTMILDHANKPGKKILMSGGGRCNFTNLEVTKKCFISNNPHFCQSALSLYTPEHFIRLVKKHRIAFYEKTLGQLFCKNSSKDILNMLLLECKQAKVVIKLNCTTNQVVRLKSGKFKIYTEDNCIICESLVIATGGLSIPTLGASPFGYQLAKQFKIPVLPVRAGLVAFTLQDQDKEKFASLSGVSVPCSVKCGKQIFHENMLFTHRGLSGPAMLQISSYWSTGDDLLINLMPNVDILEEISKIKNEKPNMLLLTALSHYFPKNLLQVWLNNKEYSQPLQNFSIKKLKKISDLFQCWCVKPNNTEGYRTAEVTLGGVDCNAISSKTFEARSVPGLHFIGEVLDVTGWLGGYNFQWAWSSGYVAGQVV